MAKIAMIGAGSLVVLFVLLGTFASSAFYALAGFVGAGLIFGGATGICGMAKLLSVMPEGLPLRYAGRPERASPAEGYPAAHQAEQKRIVGDALAT